MAAPGPAGRPVAGFQRCHRDGLPTPAPSARVATVPERVLFIGNSHTHRYGGMDWLVGNLVASEDSPRTYEAERLTASGVTLEYHYQNGAPERIREGDWDVVVLQEYLPASPTRTAEPFLDYARRFDEIVRESGARTVFYMTWPQGRYDWADLDDFVAAHRQVEAELGARIAPVGVAMARAQAERPDLALIGADEVHATWVGAYLAAAVIYATLFDRSPQGLDYTFGDERGGRRLPAAHRLGDRHRLAGRRALLRPDDPPATSHRRPADCHAQMRVLPSPPWTSRWSGSVACPTATHGSGSDRSWPPGRPVTRRTRCSSSSTRPS